MASITSWTRLEPRTERLDLGDGLAARLHDPLWQLARQWQIGEFTAEDTGSPVQVRVRVEQTPLTRLRPGGDGQPAIPYDPVTAPLEAIVEAEPVVPNRRLAAVAGRHLVGLLERAGAGAHVPAITGAFALAPPPPSVALDPASRRFLTVLAGRVPDGVAARAACGTGANPTVPAIPGVPAGDPTVTAAVRDFVRWYDRFVGPPGAGAPASWQRDRLEHRVAVAGPAPGGEIVLDAPEHGGGRLDWTAFDRRRGVTLGAGADSAKARVVTRTVIPARVTYRGMPAARWWQFEDSRVDFGQVEAGPTDLLRMLVLSFALDYGNDWFVAPVELDVGAVHRVRSVVTTDSFGQRTLVRPAAAVDGTRADWRMFSPSPAPGTVLATGASDDSPELLVLVPSVATGLESEAIEDVLFARDELANLAWAVERRVEGAAGGPVDRTATRRRRPPPPTGDGDELRYRLSTTVPAHWLPLVPVRANPAKPDVVLRRGRVLLDVDGTPQTPGALGRVLDPGQPLDLREEEVPRSGVHVTRHHELVRWIGGTTHHWIARRKRPGRGEAWSGLRFDVIEPGP